MSLNHRYDFVLLFDVKDGIQTVILMRVIYRVLIQKQVCLVTDVSLKRKVRNFVGMLHEEQPPYEIYVKEKSVLNLQHVRAYKALDMEDLLEPDKSGHLKSKGKADDADKARRWMCQNFYDVRSFGAVMSTGVNCGQVRNLSK